MAGPVPDTTRVPGKIFHAKFIDRRRGALVPGKAWVSGSLRNPSKSESLQQCAGKTDIADRTNFRHVKKETGISVLL
jgi:hypothetical protein